MKPTTEMLIRNRLSAIKNDLEWIAKQMVIVKEQLDNHLKTKVLLESQEAELVKELQDAGKTVEDAPISS